MSNDFTVTGADDFLRLSKSLKAAGNGELRKELNKSLRNAAKPIIKATRAAALSRLPSRGGLAGIVAKEPQRVQVRTGTATAGVRIVVGKNKGAARAADAGVIRHPVFGRDVFVTQAVPPGWFSETAQEQAGVVRDELKNALEEVKRKAVG